jgi:hypothetical protein
MLEVQQPTRPTNARQTRTLSRPSHGTFTGATAYAFDYCAGPTTSQAELFTALDMPALCEAAMLGEVVTVFCFGQTGSGKTYTLSGRTIAEGETTVTGDGEEELSPLVAEDGLQYQAAAYVARRLKEMRHAAKRRRKSKGEASFVSRQAHRGSTLGDGTPTATTSLPAAADAVATIVAKCSYVELYQETLYDLLQPDSTEIVRCRWSAAAQSFYVEGSLLVECRNADDFLMVLREGQRNRQRGCHALNRDSSRSHVVFTIFFDVCEGDREDEAGAVQRNGKGGSGRRYGRLVFVDLAGSERLKKTQSASGAETGSINKSLFTLGHVLELLSAAPSSSADNAKPPFIPYRSSILTQLLMQSLDGHGRTLMIACVSPSALHLDESLRTLHYAQRARHIQTVPVVHVDAATQQRMTLEERVRELLKENAMLRRALQLPRAGPLTEADVQAQAETLRRVVASETHTSNAAVTHSPPATREAPLRGRSTSSPVPLPVAAKKAAVPPLTSHATRANAVRVKEKKADNRAGCPSLRSVPLTALSHDQGDTEDAEEGAAPRTYLPPAAVTPPSQSACGEEEMKGTVNILALLDALPDTRSMT